MKKIFLSMIMLAAGCFTASAQQQTETKEVFNPHWYVQAQGGAQYTLGEVDFCDLLGVNAQVAGGYKFSPVWGARLTVGAWQSKGGVTFNGKDYKYKWNYIAPTANVTFDVLNAICGYKQRPVSVGLFAGVGANIAFGNSEATTAREAIIADARKNIVAANPNATYEGAEFMTYLWHGPKTRFVGQFGANVDYNISSRVALGIEFNCNVLTDRYNSKKAGNADWYFNTLVGVKYALGKTSKKVEVPVPAPTVIERIVEKHDTVYINNGAATVAQAREPLRRDVFYTIRVSEVSKAEMPKIEDVAEYLNRYPDSKVTITGYADKGTGNSRINMTYARKRAEMVADLLVNKFGISKSRITVDSKGDTVQPFENNNLNRVSICVAE